MPTLIRRVTQNNGAFYMIAHQWDNGSTTVYVTHNGELCPNDFVVEYARPYFPGTIYAFGVPA